MWASLGSLLGHDRTGRTEALPRDDSGAQGKFEKLVQMEVLQLMDLCK